MTLGFFRDGFSNFFCDVFLMKEFDENRTHVRSKTVLWETETRATVKAFFVDKRLSVVGGRKRRKKGSAESIFLG